MVRIRVDFFGIKVHNSNTYKIPINFGYVTVQIGLGFLGLEKYSKYPKIKNNTETQKNLKTQINTLKIFKFPKNPKFTINMS